MNETSTQNATGNSIVLRRDCAATLVPLGTAITLESGRPVIITQALGSSYTVLIDGNLARIDGRDADALGFEPAVRRQPAADAGPVAEARIWEQLRTCYDPEIPVNIVDLGLIYDCQVIPLPAGGSKVEVKMTLTAPGCGMSEILKTDIENKIREMPGVAEAVVEVVWDPPWNQSMMSDTAKLELGLM
jgi:probable FeS assembly SUF system protein SufT